LVIKRTVIAGRRERAQESRKGPVCYAPALRARHLIRESEMNAKQVRAFTTSSAASEKRLNGRVL
jgi:hypothetical protein